MRRPRFSFTAHVGPAFLRRRVSPGSPGGTSTPNSAANPPNFTYAFTTIVGRGAVGCVVFSIVGRSRAASERAPTRWPPTTGSLCCWI